MKNIRRDSSVIPGTVSSSSYQIWMTDIGYAIVQALGLGRCGRRGSKFNQNTWRGYKGWNNLRLAVSSLSCPYQLWLSCQQIQKQVKILVRVLATKIQGQGQWFSQ